MAALVALAKNDIANAREIAEDFDDSGGLPANVLKAMMACTMYSTSDGRPHPDYDPTNKTALVKKYIRSLSSIFDIDDRSIATFIIRLA
jgi:hypothetical protein